MRHLKSMTGIKPLVLLLLALLVASFAAPGPIAAKVQRAVDPGLSGGGEGDPLDSNDYTGGSGDDGGDDVHDYSSDPVDDGADDFLSRFMYFDGKILVPTFNGVYVSFQVIEISASQRTAGR